MAACSNEHPEPCGSQKGDIRDEVLTRLDCRAPLVSVAGPRSQIAAIASLPAGSLVLVLRDPDYLVLVSSDTTRTTPLLLPDTVERQRPIGVAVTDDTLASVLFYPLGDIAVYSIPSLSRRSIARSVTRASSLAPWRGGHAVTHAARDSGIVVTADVLGPDSPSSVLFSDRFMAAPRAVNLFGRALVAASESTLAVIADVADVSVILDRHLRLLDSVAFPVRRRHGAPVDIAATLARWDSTGPSLSDLGVSSPAALAFGDTGAIRVVFEDLELRGGEWGSQAYISSSQLRGVAECVDVPIPGATHPRRHFAFRGDTLFIVSLDSDHTSRVIVERRLLDPSLCLRAP